MGHECCARRHSSCDQVALAERSKVIVGHLRNWLRFRLIGDKYLASQSISLGQWWYGWPPSFHETEIAVWQAPVG